MDEQTQTYDVHVEVPLLSLQCSIVLFTPGSVPALHTDRWAAAAQPPAQARLLPGDPYCKVAAFNCT